MNIPLFKIYWDEDDVDSVSSAIRAGMNWAIGPNIEKLETLIADYIGTKYALVFNSGTSAIHSTLHAYGIGPGDEVIVPSFTFIATPNAVKFVGGEPVFADIEKETFGLDPEDVERKITNRAKAIMPIHYGGGPCKIEKLRRIADDNNLILVEDAAEAFGAKIRNRKVGTFGDSSVLSFCANKIISTGEGGAVVTDSEKIYEKLKLVRSHGRSGEDYFSKTKSEYVEIGYNFRMSNINAALGISQIKKADKIIEMRRDKFDYMSKSISRIDDVFVTEPTEENFHVRQMFTVIVENGRRDDLAKHLKDNGIISKIFFEPVHTTKFYSEKYREIKLPATEEVSQKVLSIPIYPHMTTQEMDSIVNSIRSFE